VNDAIDQLSSEIEAGKAKVDVAQLMPTVSGNKRILVQIITNLLSNAIKFVAADVCGEIRVWAERRDGLMIRLWIEDNGIGIDQANQDRIFRVFERLHGIESYPGTGIGLALVSRACARLGGRYGVESQLGEGSRFWVEFQECRPTKRLRTMTRRSSSRLTS
jgi:signal transduction histidine kinase